MLKIFVSVKSTVRKGICSEKSFFFLFSLFLIGMCRFCAQYLLCLWLEWFMIQNHWNRKQTIIIKSIMSMPHRIKALRSIIFMLCQFMWKKKINIIWRIRLRLVASNTNWRYVELFSYNFDIHHYDIFLL